MEQTDSNTIKKATPAIWVELPRESSSVPLFVLDSHIQEFDKESITHFLCNACHRTFSSMENFQDHVSCPHDYCCPHCPRKFILMDDFFEHVSNHHIEHELDIDNSAMTGRICPVRDCNIEFRTEEELEAHVDINHKCPCVVTDCNFVSLDIEAWQDHMISCHSMSSILQCIVCSKAFATEDEIWQHYISVHKGVRISCGSCDFSSPIEDISAMNQHLANQGHMFKLPEPDHLESTDETNTVSLTSNEISSENTIHYDKEPDENGDESVSTMDSVQVKSTGVKHQSILLTFNEGVSLNELENAIKESDHCGQVEVRPLANLSSLPTSSNLSASKDPLLRKQPSRRVQTVLPMTQEESLTETTPSKVSVDGNSKINRVKFGATETLNNSVLSKVRSINSSDIPMESSNANLVTTTFEEENGDKNEASEQLKNTKKKEKENDCEPSVSQLDKNNFENSFHCKTCRVTLTEAQVAIRHHVTTRHTITLVDTKKGMFTCQFCGKSSSTYRGSKAHERAAHSVLIFKKRRRKGVKKKIPLPVAEPGSKRRRGRPPKPRISTVTNHEKESHLSSQDKNKIVSSINPGAESATKKSYPGSKAQKNNSTTFINSETSHIPHKTESQQNEASVESNVLKKATEDISSTSNETQIQVPKRKRGRPRKHSTPDKQKKFQMEMDNSRVQALDLVGEEPPKVGATDSNEQEKCIVKDNPLHGDKEDSRVRDSEPGNTSKPLDMPSNNDNECQSKSAALLDQTEVTSERKHVCNNSLDKLSEDMKYNDSVRENLKPISMKVPDDLFHENNPSIADTDSSVNLDDSNEEEPSSSSKLESLKKQNGDVVEQVEEISEKNVTEVPKKTKKISILSKKNVQALSRKKIRKKNKISMKIEHALEKPKNTNIMPESFDMDVSSEKSKEEQSPNSVSNILSSIESSQDEFVNQNGNQALDEKNEVGIEKDCTNKLESPPVPFEKLSVPPKHGSQNMHRSLKRKLLRKRKKRQVNKPKIEAQLPKNVQILHEKVEMSESPSSQEKESQIEIEKMRAKRNLSTARVVIKVSLRREKQPLPETEKKRTISDDKTVKVQLKRLTKREIESWISCSKPLSDCGLCGKSFGSYRSMCVHYRFCYQKQLRLGHNKSRRDPAMQSDRHSSKVQKRGNTCFSH